MAKILENVPAFFSDERPRVTGDLDEDHQVTITVTRFTDDLRNVDLSDVVIPLDQAVELAHAILAMEKAVK